MPSHKVLIIDDDNDILETVGALLKHQGFDVYGEETVEDGLDAIDDISPNLILLDIMFPEKKTRGFEAAKEIKKKYPGLPIIVFTAINREYAFDFTKEDIQADEFVNKPVEIDRLVKLIKKYL